MWSKDSVEPKGVSLVEALIGVAIIVAAVIAAFLYYGIALRVAQQSTDRVQAAVILSETAEAVRTIRDASWSNISSLSVGTDYHLYFTGSAWQATTTPYLVEGKFTRIFRVSEVSRDSNDDIVTSGGTIDPDTKKVTVGVTWGDSPETNASLEMYLANIFD